MLAAHSLACSLVAHWSTSPGVRAAGALLVAPADVDSPAHTADEVRDFSPVPPAPLPFPSIVVASTVDGPGLQGPLVRVWRAGRPRRLRRRAGGDHLGAARGMGSQQAMEPQQMKAGGRDEHTEFLDELQGIEQQMRRAVSAGTRQLIQELPPGALRLPLQGQGRAEQVPGQVFELLAGVSGQGDVGV